MSKCGDTIRYLYDFDNSCWSHENVDWAECSCFGAKGGDCGLMRKAGPRFVQREQG